MRRGLALLSGLALLGAIACGPKPSAEPRSEGERIFRSVCRTCHSLPKPKSRTDEQWPALVQKYGDRGKLTEHQIALVTEYLLSVN